MVNYDYLSVSNGSGDAALMHVNGGGRTAGSTVIPVDSVVNVPAKFIGTYGALGANGLITSSSKRDFTGHVSGATLVIDSFLPGSTDNGNNVGDIVIVKPNTSWADNMVALARVAHNDDGTLKTSAIAALYPIGSIYTSTVATNPNTLFGFGTWVAFGAGKVLVGKAASGTFNTAGATGGVETNDFTHIHGTDAQGNHSHGGGTGYFLNNGGGSDIITTHAGSSPPSHYHGIGADGNHGHNIDSRLGVTTNLQPYIVVYMWNRTA